MDGAFTGKLPYGVTASRREGERNLWFLQNFNASEVEAELPDTYTRVADGARVEGKVVLKPYECGILAEKQADGL